MFTKKKKDPFRDCLHDTEIIFFFFLVCITDSSQYKLISFFTGQFLNDLTKSPDQLNEDIMLSFNHLKSPCHWKDK